MQLCGTTLSMPVYTDLFSMRLKLTSGATYSKNLDCTVTIQADLDEKLMVYFEVMDIEETTDCSSDWLEVYDGESRFSPHLSGSVFLCLYPFHKC